MARHLSRRRIVVIGAVAILAATFAVGWLLWFAKRDVTDGRVLLSNAGSTAAKNVNLRYRCRGAVETQHIDVLGPGESITLSFPCGDTIVSALTFQMNDASCFPEADANVCWGETFEFIIRDDGTLDGHYKHD